MKPRIKVVKSGSSLPGSDDSAYEEITLAEQAHRMLKRDIISGALPAGQALRLEHLKERYGISFSPLREALNRLHSERLVVSTPSRGFRASPFSEEEMWDVIETRIVIECEALRRSLARGDEAWEGRLVLCFEALMLATGRRLADTSGSESADDNQLEERHYDFHHSLISACGSRWLLNLSEQLYAQTERYRQPSLRDGNYGDLKRDVGAEHRQLLDAAVARDAVLAAGLLARHYRETGRTVKRLLAMTGAESATT